jgi:hypothetical protein
MGPVSSIRCCLVGGLLAAAFALPARAAAQPEVHKAIWGPPTEFPTYSDLGVGIYQTTISWRSVALARPTDPTDPNDPAYHWPADLDTAMADASQRGIAVAVNLEFAPGWANGHRGGRWTPKKPSDLADFALAASRRYPYVRYWLIWAEPSRRGNFMPLARVRSDRPLTHSEQRGPRLYARMLDASYSVLKSVDPADQVVGGLTIPGGDIRPQRFIEAMRLPGGKPPRMDLYGHNAYSPRLPKLSRDPAASGTADLSDLDTLCGWLDRYLGRDGRNRKLKVFVSEYSLPTDHASSILPFWGSRRDQARFLAAALKLTRTFPRLYTLGWFSLKDQRPRPSHLETDWGLLDSSGSPKPSYYVYRNG